MSVTTDRLCQVGELAVLNTLLDGKHNRLEVRPPNFCHRSIEKINLVAGRWLYSKLRSHQAPESIGSSK